MRLCFQSVVPLGRERVFTFFRNPGNIPLLYKGWPRVQVLEHEDLVRVGAETWVETTVAWFVPMVLGFRHTVFEPPVRFAEEAIHGPFARFEHIHEFEQMGNQTLVRDLLTVELPWHYGGEEAMKRVVAPGLTRMFRSRATALEGLACAGTLARSARLRTLLRQS